ncbi:MULTISPECIES: archease [Methanoculleus]|jgi:SHS2 domain-containing protein|uniref:SHS2 domain-containing protein n=1 Tax=Methanoculleus thermophilus TaxID=2200 RepID=A0A1G8YWQ1_9EURY|nr:MULTISPECIES: archease [Methanoculleus]NLN08596.1 archease [Methanoculleus thermophilus]SDK07223.1 SHS2 domain-containing protein [Methanoculleus thermophilus]HQD24941.1 archease [Methanoculleus thermophilus]
MSFEELEHTADVQMRVRGRTINELFADAGRAMFQIMYGPCIDRGVTREISLEADNLEALLIDYLSELLFITEVEGTVFCTFDVDVQGTRLTATARGEPFDPKRHSGGTIVKGISYFGLEIVKEEEGYVVEIIFDI